MGDDPVPIYVDNKGAIDLTRISGITKRSKHIDTRFHYSREQQLQGVIDVRHVSTAEMIADGFTKPLASAKFRSFLDQLGLQ